MSRKKTSAFEDLVDTTAKMPWQAGIVLAVIAYAMLHYFASRMPLTTNPVELKAAGKSVADSMVHGIGTMVASVFQYILPIFFLLGSYLLFLAAVARANCIGRLPAIQPQTLWRR